MTFSPIQLTVTAAPTPFILVDNTSEPFVLNGAASGDITLQLGTSLAGAVSLVGPSSLKGVDAFISGVPSNNEILIASIAPYGYEISLDNCFAEALLFASNETILTIKLTVGGVTTTIGTITFAAGTGDGVFDFTETVIPKGSLLTVNCPAIADATLGDIAFLLAE